MAGFDQRYVTATIRLPMPCWSIVIGDFRHLLHCVESGTGLRFSVVLCNHRTTVSGLDEFGREVWAAVPEPMSDKDQAKMAAEMEAGAEMDLEDPPCRQTRNRVYV